MSNFHYVYILVDVVALHRWIIAQGNMMSDESDKSDMSDKKHCYFF